MAWPTRSSDPTRTPRNSLIAAGLLVAVASVLIGFHGMTMVLSAVSPVAEHDGAQGRTESDRPDSKRTAHAPMDDRARDAARTEPEPVPPPTGLAAAAKARALADMKAMEPAGLEAERQAEESDQERPPKRPRRVYRAPPVDKHKVY